MQKKTIIKTKMLSLSRNLQFGARNARRILINSQQSHRNKTTTPVNIGILFVPQQVSVIFTQIIMIVK